MSNVSHVAVVGHHGKVAVVVEVEESPVIVGPSAGAAGKAGEVLSSRSVRRQFSDSRDVCHGVTGAVSGTTTGHRAVAVLHGPRRVGPHQHLAVHKVGSGDGYPQEAAVPVVAHASLDVAGDKVAALPPGGQHLLVATVARVGH